jgi:mannose-6-phosphate isomerase-like protein (cupin superfamily)
MRPSISRAAEKVEFETPERCSILESWNSPDDRGVSIARACVEPGVVTQLHALDGCDERYLVVSGTGLVDVGELVRQRVDVGDVVMIPAGTVQRIDNDADHPLVFYCICTPPFRPEFYRNLE